LKASLNGNANSLGADFGAYPQPQAVSGALSFISFFASDNVMERKATVRRNGMEANNFNAFPPNYSVLEGEKNAFHSVKMLNANIWPTFASAFLPAMRARGKRCKREISEFHNQMLV
jgi:hypothetical protein